MQKKNVLQIIERKSIKKIEGETKKQAKWAKVKKWYKIYKGYEGLSFC